jgi:hypothetical protein
MSRRPPSESSERPGRSPVGPLGTILVVTCMVAAVACGNRPPSGSSSASPDLATTIATATTGPSPDGSADVEPGDLDGLVVLTGDALSIGSPAGALIPFHGPAVDAFSATRGRLIVQTAGPSFSIADIDRAGVSPPAWRVVDLPALDGRRLLSAPVLSDRGDRIAVEIGAPGRAIGFDVLVIDLAGGVPTVVSIGREANGPPVWIDDSSLLLEVLPTPGGTRFLRLDFGTGQVAPIAADGFGPAISGDGSLLAIASADGSVVAVPAAGWLAGSPPDEGTLVDASGSVFELVVDVAGRRVAIGYADDAGDPASIAVFVRGTGAWRRNAVPARVVPGGPTMLGWLN